MRSIRRNTVIVLMTALAMALFFTAPRDNAVGRAPAPVSRRHALIGTIKLKGDPPDLEALNKRLAEVMKLKDTDYCLKCADPEKTQQTYRLGGRDNRQVGNVFVWIRPDTGTFFEVEDKQLKALDKEVKIRQPHCAFIPHCAFLFSQYRPDAKKPREIKPTGQVLKVANDAQIGHNTNWSGGSRNRGDNLILGKGTERIIDNLVPEAKEVTIKCNIHPWMSAYLWVVDTPYYALSFSDTLDGKNKVAKADPKFGTYEIKNPPAGKVRILAWHEACGYLNKDGAKGEVIELRAKGTTRKDFELTAR